MTLPPSLRVAYLLKMYPRFSETFIVNEILAHEAAGMDLEIISLRLPNDGRFHREYAQVQAPVTYIPTGSSKVSALWPSLRRAALEFPHLWAVIRDYPQLDAGDLHQAIAVARHVRERGIHLIHAHFGSIAATVARTVHLLTGVPYVFTAHAKDIFHESVDPEDLQAKLADAAAVITVSNYNLDFLQSRYGVAAHSVQRIYNGLDLNRFPFDPPVDRPRRIVGVGRLVEKKGFIHLVEACALLAKRGVDFECRISGKGDQEEVLRRCIQAHGLSDRVQLLGPQPQDQVIQQVRTGAVFAAPCVVGRDGNRDGLPTVLLEAMALGAPCVSTDVTGIPEVLIDQKTGLLVPQRDPVALAAALERLLDAPALRVQLAGQARGLMEREFDIRANSARLRELYARVAQPLEMVS